MKDKMFDTSAQKESCITITVCTKASDDMERKSNEITLLAKSAGLKVLDNIKCNVKDINRSTIIGSGKLQEIKQALDEMEDVSVVIVDYPLTGSQSKNISDVLCHRVLDRVGLIIDIFAQRANSSEAKLQVKLAQDKYLLPRLKEIQGSSGRYGGAGVGMRGPGESKLELNRRVLENEVISLRKQIEKIKEQRKITRRARNTNNAFKIALVGYTNAGKSSLLNLLAKENIYADDRLFATLDTTSRNVYISQKDQAIVTDTVGFISDLPHELVDAFSSTLEEAADADLILHVVDGSLNKIIDGKPEYMKNIKVTDEVLDQIGCTKERIMVLNKIDLVQGPLLLPPNCVMISVKTGKGINNLMTTIILAMQEIQKK